MREQSARQANSKIIENGCHVLPEIMGRSCTVHPSKVIVFIGYLLFVPYIVNYYTPYVVFCLLPYVVSENIPCIAHRQLPYVVH